eukprot:894874-Rhodomonas_salina.1
MIISLFALSIPQSSNCVAPPHSCCGCSNSPRAESVRHGARQRALKHYYTPSASLKNRPNSQPLSNHDSEHQCRLSPSGSGCLLACQTFNLRPSHHHLRAPAATLQGQGAIALLDRSLRKL